MTSTTLKLKSPIDLDGTTYEMLDLEEPSVAQLSAALGKSNPTDQKVELIAAAARIPVAVIKRMKVSDFERAWTVIESFMQPAGQQKTGAA